MTFISFNSANEPYVATAYAEADDDETVRWPLTDAQPQRPTKDVDGIYVIITPAGRAVVSLPVNDHNPDGLVVVNEQGMIVHSWLSHDAQIINFYIENDGGNFALMQENDHHRFIVLGEGHDYNGRTQ